MNCSLLSSIWTILITIKFKYSLLSFCYFIIGGWHGFKEMVVFKKEQESTDTISFYFRNIDGSKLADSFKPGQYLSIRIRKEMFGEDTEYDMTRNYSMSCAPGLGHYRCTIKRDNSGDQTGMVSNYMHDHVNVNDKILVGK